MKFLSALSSLLAASSAVQAQRHAFNARAEPNNTASGGMAPMPTAGSGSSNVSQLLDTLGNVGPYKTLASLLKQHASMIASIPMQNLTLLAPTDQAFAKLGNALTSAPHEAIMATLLYHVLNGSYSTTGEAVFQANKHTIAPTLLQDPNFVHLPANASQVVVLSRNQDGYPVVVTPAGNVDFVSKNDNITLGTFSLHGINSVLPIPLNLTATLAQSRNLTKLSAALYGANLTAPLNQSPGLTIFAPNDAAFVNATKEGYTNQPDAKLLSALLANHVINGTVIYSSELATLGTKNAADKDKKGADGSTLIASLITSTGAKLNLTQDTTGSFWVNSNSTSARLVAGGSDILYNGGVIHTIDKVLYNTATDASALSDSVSKNNHNSGADSSSSPTHSKDNGSGPMLHADVVVLAAIATLVTLAGTAVMMI
ncbi:unnamed protein product [Sympodiomycopsis kandeliae]